jgi:L-aminopeptidase/D-esterase-like protein
MPTGFQRTKNQHNKGKRQDRQDRRKEVRNGVQKLMDGKEDFGGSNIKNGEGMMTFGRKGGLSTGNSYASHRKRTTRQKHKLEILSKRDLQQ